jgi:hypothetical protein
LFPLSICAIIDMFFERLTMMFGIVIKQKG